VFVRSVLWFWGRRERTGEGWWIDSAESSRDYASGFRALRSALWPFSLSLSLPLSPSLLTYAHANPVPIHTHTHAHTHVYVYAHTLPQRHAYVCKDIRGLITIPACTRSQTRKESKEETEMRSRKRTRCLGTPVLRTVLDFIGFSRVRFSFS